MNDMDDGFREEDDWPESARTRIADLRRQLAGEKMRAAAAVTMSQAPIPMRLPCPSCHALHIDEGEFETKHHHTHACQSCGEVWRPAIVNTVGVRFLLGFKQP